MLVMDSGYELTPNPLLPLSFLYPSFSPTFLFSSHFLSPEQRDAGAAEEPDEGGDQGVQVQRDAAASGLH